MTDITPISKGACPTCGRPLENKTHSDHSPGASTSGIGTAVTLVAGHLPQDDQVQFAIGLYKILHKIGQGGMGEVFLAYDTTCGRRIALKRIRSDLLSHQQMHRRFLKEARITSQLTHPAIIPIYSIHDEENLVYYTMPYVEGKTLKQILRSARTFEKEGIKPENHEGSITSLIRIFLSVCQAVGYAHSKGVLHRDLKPENVIVGKYGEVLILDWGLAKLIHKDGHQEKKKEDSENEFLSEPKGHHPFHALTNLGKVVGTVPYMAPERAMGGIATTLTDIYSLGIILYQILTLRYPFFRKNLKEFRQTMHNEVLLDPSTVAPHRDVPRVLAQMAMKCLTVDTTQRYQHVDQFLHDLESYIEGRAEWFMAAELAIDRKTDWEFQENVLIAEHMAITRSMDVSDWVSLMISKASFDEPIKIEVDIKLGENGHGLGFLLSVPESAERVQINDGYTLWLSSDLHNTTKLLRSTVEVFHSSDVILKRNEWYHVKIEKIDRHIHLYLNGQLQFSYLGLLPVVGTHIGLLSRDADFKLTPLKVFVGGQNIMVKCLAVPDAFLAHKDYVTALSEYRRIGSSFPGRAEGREAMFRAGITLLEQAKTAGKEDQEILFEHAFEEFQKLHGTPGAPFEYLGKALIYQSLNDPNEELKCYELALRRYPGHPLIEMLKEHILYRMHESSRSDRDLTYCYILLVTRHLTEKTTSPPVKKLLNSLERHWELLYFIEDMPKTALDGSLRNLNFSIQLAFWLAKPLTLLEIATSLQKIEDNTDICKGNLFFSLIELGALNEAETVIADLYLESSSADTCTITSESISSSTTMQEPLRIVLQANRQGLSSVVESIMGWDNNSLNFAQERAILYLMEKALDENELQNLQLQSIVERFSEVILSSSTFLIQMHCYKIWAALQNNNWNEAGEMLRKHSLEELTQEMSLLHFLYGCWLYVAEGAEIASIHFSGVLETTYPRSWTLFSHFYNRKNREDKEWHLQAFQWEKRQFYRQASLFYHCAGNEEEAKLYKELVKQAACFES